MKIGDRVVLVPDIGWNQPFRGWAERGRVATVTNVFTPQGGKRTVVKVRFDRTRVKGALAEHCFDPSDLRIAKEGV